MHQASWPWINVKLVDLHKRNTKITGHRWETVRAKAPHCTQFGSLEPINDRHRVLPLRVKLIDPAGWIL